MWKSLLFVAGSCSEKYLAVKLSFRVVQIFLYSSEMHFSSTSSSNMDVQKDTVRQDVLATLWPGEVLLATGDGCATDKRFHSCAIRK